MSIIKKTFLHIEEERLQTTSQASWEILKPFLKEAFFCMANEELVSIEVSQTGIKGHFIRK